MEYNNERYVVEYLEKIRLERDVKIKDLTKDITSLRNYSRLLSGEAAMSFEMLHAFLQRLSLPIYQFGGYVRNSMIVDNMVVFQFCDAVMNGNYQGAYDELYPQIEGKEWDIPLTSKHLPISISFMKYKLKMISKIEALDQINRVLDLSTILDSKIVNHDDITLLNLYLQISNDEAKDFIADTVYKYTQNKKLKILSGIIDVTKIYMYILVLKSIITKENISRRDHNRIKKVLNDFLVFQKKSQTDLLDFEIFGLIYDYIKKYKIRNDLVIFNFLSTVITFGIPQNIAGQQIEIEAKDIEIFHSLLDDKELLRESMYERLCSYDVL